MRPIWRRRREEEGEEDSLGRVLHACLHLFFIP